MEDSNQHFKFFTEGVKFRRSLLIKDKKEDKFLLQERQFTKLWELEEQFKQTLIHSEFGKEAYQFFIKYIKTHKRNILSSRPYFRERQTVFTASIAGAFKTDDWRTLYEFKINYQFVALIMNFLGDRATPKLQQLYKEISQLRKDIADINMPLVISRANTFWKRTPKSHLSRMDIIQIASEGMMNAIDKFTVVKWIPKFHMIAIGRMLGNCIEAYTETVLRFFPLDKRKLYRANKWVARNPGGDYEQLAHALTVESDGVLSTNANEIYNLLSATHCVSANAKVPGKILEQTENINIYPNPEELRPDSQFENMQAMHVLYEAIKTLPLMDQKLLSLKGVDLSAMMR